MRKFVATCVVVLCVLALGACSSGSKKAASATGSSSGTSTGSSSSRSRAATDTKQFCIDLIKAGDAIGSTAGSGASEALAVFASVNPPSALADVWDDYLKAIEEASHLGSNDSAGAAQVGIRHAQSLAKVTAFLSQSCTGVAASDLSS